MIGVFVHHDAEHVEDGLIVGNSDATCANDGRLRLLLSIRNWEDGGRKSDVFPGDGLLDLPHSFSYNVSNEKTHSFLLLGEDECWVASQFWTVSASKTDSAIIRVIEVASQHSSVRLRMCFYTIRSPGAAPSCFPAGDQVVCGFGRFFVPEKKKSRPCCLV